MIYIFFNNDPLADDQGGGAEHLRGIYRHLKRTKRSFRIIASRMQSEYNDPCVEYISKSAHFGRYYIALWWWFIINRKKFNTSDVFHFHRNYASWPKHFFSPNTGKVILTYHMKTGQVLASMLGIFSTPIRWLTLIAERKALTIANYLVFVSENVKEEVFCLARGCQLPPNDIVVPGFYRSLFKNSTPPKKEHAHKIGLLGRLEKIKNIPLAISALEYINRDNSRFRLYIGGNGSQKQSIKRIIQNSSQVDNIVLLGQIDHSSVPNFLSSIGILLVTSDYESGPIVVKEALSARRPVVTTNVGDVSNWIDGTNGIVCSNTPKEIAKAIRRVSSWVERGYVPSAFDSNFEFRTMEQLASIYDKLANTA